MNLGHSLGLARKRGVDPGAAVAALAPVAWYRYGRGITSSVGAVSQWADQSGNSRHLIQATGSAQPLLDTDNSLLFDGVDDRMYKAFTLAQPETVFMLWKRRRYVTGSDVHFDGYDDVTMAIQDLGTTPEIRSLPGGLISGASSPAIGSYGVTTGVYNGASSSIRLNLGTATTGTITESTAAGGFTLGSRGAAGVAFSNINVREVIIFNKTLSAADANAVVSYLMSVGGVP